MGNALADTFRIIFVNQAGPGRVHFARYTSKIARLKKSVKET